MATEKKATANGDGDKQVPRGNPDDPEWYLSRGSIAARFKAEHDSERREEYVRLAHHLRLLATDPDYRAEILGGIDAYLEDKPEHRPVERRQRQAETFRRVVGLFLDEHRRDPRRVTEAILCQIPPLVLGDVKLPKLADVVDKAELEVRGAIKRTKKKTRPEEHTAVARSVLRAVYVAGGVDKEAARKMAHDLYR